ncbi:MAG: class I tRNA ligase family protein, partial [Lentisphaeria bacterium]|nr:class I tRNA ligase family protein [Lentisphaeria bacterium]
MFEKVSSQISFPNLEKDVLQFWKENRIFEKSLEARKHAEEFVFYDGPPFATGLPHYG